MALGVNGNAAAHDFSWNVMQDINFGSYNAKHVILIEINVFFVENDTFHMMF